MKSGLLSGIDISYKLRCLGWTQSALARELNVSPSLVNNVIHNRITGYKVAIKISEILDSDLHSLWPDRYIFKPRGLNKKNKEKEGSM